MPERKPLLLRLDPVTLDALRGWAADDLRSLNGQVEFVLRRALREAGRLPAPRLPAVGGVQAAGDRSGLDEALPDPGAETDGDPAVHPRGRRHPMAALAEKR